MVTVDFDEYIEKVFNHLVGRIVVLTQNEVQRIIGGLIFLGSLKGI